MAAPDGHSPADFIAPRCEEEPQVLYSDEHILIVTKPSGLLSVPGRHPDNHDSLATRLQKRWPGAIIVHRLDMDTSGIMVLALHKKAHANLSAQFQYRKVDKTYEAVVSGVVKEDSGSVDLPLITDWPNRPLQKVCFEEGKPSLTRYAVHKRMADCTLVRLEPETGRSHQLRVHMKEIGHPILGDRFYGDERIVSASPRLLLHAKALGFTHPATDEPIRMECSSVFESILCGAPN